jgi:hypothetical protein
MMMTMTTTTTTKTKQQLKFETDMNKRMMSPVLIVEL